MRKFSQSKEHDRRACDTCLEQAAANLTESAYEKARYSIANPKPKPRPETTAAAMRTIAKEYEAELGIGQS